MVRNILLIVGFVLLAFLYLRILICYLKYKKIIVQDIDGFSVAKEITSDYDFIHIVEAKGQIFSYYDAKRNVIRLTSVDYYSSDLFHFGIVFLLAKYACYYQEEKLSNLFCKIFLRVYVLFFSAFIGSIISLFTHTIGDAKIGVFLFVILLLIYYFYLKPIFFFIYMIYSIQFMEEKTNTFVNISKIETVRQNASHANYSLANI